MIARGAADVVRVAVRHHQRVEATDAERPQRRRDHPPADVEPGLSFGGARAARRRHATRVDQHRAAARQNDGCRITLPDVEEHNAHSACWRRHRVDCPCGPR